MSKNNTGFRWLRKTYALSVRSLRKMLSTSGVMVATRMKYLEGSRQASGEDLSPVQNARLKMVKERSKVMKKAKSKKARKLWLTYAKEQAAEWQELVS